MFSVYVLAHDALYRANARWFHLEVGRLDAIACLVFGLHKIGIWLLFLTPYLALCVVRALA